MAESRHKKLSPAERWAVRLHLMCCRYCRAVLKQLRAVDRLARGRGETAEQLSDEARRRIAAEIRRSDRQ